MDKGGGKWGKGGTPGPCGAEKMKSDNDPHKGHQAKQNSTNTGNTL